MKLLFPVTFLALIGMASYAASVTVTFTTLQTKYGVLQNVYYQTVSGPGSTTPGVNTALTPPGGTGTYSVTPGTSAYLWSPSFTSATTIPASKAVLDIWASATPTTFGLDGSASGTGTTTATSTLTTANPYDVIYVVVVIDTGTINTPRGTGLSFLIRQAALSFSGGVMATYYAIANSQLSAVAITETATGSGAANIVAFGISGANTASPFDLGVGIPASATGTSASPTVSITTTYANDFIIGAEGDNSRVGLPTANAPFTLIRAQQDSSPVISAAAEYQIVTANQVGLIVGMTADNSVNGWAMIADAVRKASAFYPLHVTIRSTDSSGTAVSTLLSSTATASVPTTTGQVATIFSIASGSVPASGYLEVIIRAPTRATITINWGTAQLSNFQIAMKVLT